MKKSIVLIPLPSLIKKKFVRSFVPGMLAADQCFQASRVFTLEICLFVSSV